MTTTFNLTAQQMLTRAYRLLGILPSGGVPNDDQATQGLIALNAMLKGWQADGINLWRLTQLSLAVGAGQGVPGNPVSIVPLVLDVPEARWVVTPGINLYEREMGRFQYMDYQTLPNKLSGSSSGPSIFMFDKQAQASNLYLWPPPSVSGTINATVARTVNTVTSVSDSVDIPDEWTEGTFYSLADRLMDDEGVAAADEATAGRITQRAVAFYDKLLNFDRPTSIMVRPWGKKGSGKFWR